MAAAPIAAIDHVQLAIPPGGEPAARRFYGDRLGLAEVPKPATLAARGGCWFESGGVRIHLGVEDDFRPARKAHPALRCRDYAGLLARLAAAGIQARDATDVPGVTRCHVDDPFGNRIELVAAERTVRFKQVDVFTNRPFLGNPVAVVLDGEGLTEAEMLRIAAWTNLSETTFVSPSARASYRLRIFTPRAELPFAGHPTLGSAHAVREAGLVPADATSLVQECGAGLIAITVGPDGALALQAPAPKLSPFPGADALARALGAAPERPTIVDVGPRWVVGAIGGVDTLMTLRPDLAALEALSRQTDVTGVTVYAVANDGVEVRSFAPLHGIPEDPVCGSGNAAVAAHLRAGGDLARLSGGRYRARQGAAVGRAGEVRVAVDADAISVGGTAVTVIDGTIRLG